ncbi:hypothetical protein AVEN_29415-1 [Araneus ventricosus]|uniref:Uncharacterized protein n=1 Tax=Araneus ventricosus TaxID=182803 RepID=A0A4Y2CYN2_ARAVE|nr:hypothetical protein AVEN_29415-1 [Araneus ventricosus]
MNRFLQTTYTHNLQPFVNHCKMMEATLWPGKCFVACSESTHHCGNTMSQFKYESIFADRVHPQSATICELPQDDGGNVMVWEMFLWHALDPLITVEPL